MRFCIDLQLGCSPEGRGFTNQIQMCVIDLFQDQRYWFVTPKNKILLLATVSLSAISIAIKKSLLIKYSVDVYSQFIG